MLEIFENIPLDLHTITDVFILFMLVVTAVAVAMSKNLLVATIHFSIFGLLMALMYIILNAPDVAITEAAIGAGITSVLFLATLLLTGETEAEKKLSMVSITFLIITGLALVYTTTGLPAWGSADSPASTHVSPYYLEKTAEHMGFPNVVTAILSSYRGFDTLGEVFVVFTACVSIYMLLYGRITRKSS
jgi:multicomponent Na+:H+ antiporter subunit B